MVDFPIRIPDCDSHSPALLVLFISSDASICSRVAFLPLGNSDHVVVSVSIDFPTNAQLMTIFLLLGTVFMIIWEMFHGRIPLYLVFLLLVPNLVGGFRLKLMYTSFIVNIRSSFISMIFSCLCP